MESDVKNVTIGRVRIMGQDVTAVQTAEGVFIHGGVKVDEGVAATFRPKGGRGK